MKKRMKRITAAAAACLLSLIFAACGSSSKSNTTEDISTGQAAAYDAGQETLTRIINEGSGGLICIIL